MPDDTPKISGVERVNNSTDKSINQIREVAKWLIGAFAAVAVVLAAGSQLSEVGDLESGRLAGALLSIFAALVGIAIAIYFTVKVLTPESLTLRRAVVDESKGSEAGKAVAEDPTLLLGHGTSIGEFEERRNAALKAEDDAWAKYEANRESSDLKTKALRAEATRKRIDEAMTWVITFVRYKEAAYSFKVALRAMFVGAVITAVGITGFAWAAHPEEEKSEEKVVASAPSAIAVDLNEDGRETLVDDLGESCKRSAVPAVAIGGEPEALEVITTLSNKNCDVARFVLTPELGTYKSREPVFRESNPAPPAGSG